MEDVFKTVGNVVAVSIKKDKKTGQNLGYGFVRMATHADAVRAKDKMHNTYVGGRRIRVGWAVKNGA